MNDLLHEYHDRLGDALASRNRLAAVEKLHAEMEARIATLEPMAQPSMFPSGEDTPPFTLAEDAPAEPAIELMYSELSPRAVDVALACIDYAWPKNTVGGCWAHLNKLTASGDISEELSNEIRMNADFLFL